MARKSPKKPGVRKLPAELAARATAMKKASQGRDRTDAVELVATVKRRIERIGEDFYDIGLALAALGAARLYTALGHATFADLIRVEFGMSDTQAYKLIDTTKMPRSRALELGQEHAAAVVAIAKATPGADTPESIAALRVKIPGHKEPVDPASVSVDELRAIARLQRRPKGRQAADEAAGHAEALAKRCEVALRGEGLHRARVTAVRHRTAGAGNVYDLRITGVPIGDRRTLARVLRALA